MARKPPKKQIIEAIENSAGIMSVAAKKLNVSRASLYNWIKKDEKLKEEIWQAREAMKDLGESKLFNNIKAGDPASIFFYLKTQAKDRGYIEKQQIDFEKDATIEIGFTDED